MKIKLRGWMFFFFALAAIELDGQAIESRDCVEIQDQAAKTLQRFALLLNQISDATSFPSEHDQYIQTSIAPDNPGRIFYNPTINIENDLNPIGSVARNTGQNDKKAVEYLENFNLLYSKYETETVFFSNLHFGPIRNNGFIFLHILYNSEFRGRLKDEPDRILPRHNRVATVRAEKDGGHWRTYLQQVDFYSSQFEFLLAYSDADCDGILDSEDNCPEEAGTLRWGGCPPPPDPDFDQDGIVDHEDACPDSKGPWCAQGCPLSPVDQKTGNKQVIWQELLGNDGLDIAFDITSNEKGEIVFAGETEIDGKGKDLYMAIFDPCRKYISNRLVLGGFQDDGARKVIRIDSNHYALAGYSESSGSGSRDAWLLLTDGTQRIGERFYGTGGSLDSFSDLVQDAEGNLFLTGEKDGKLWLLKTDRTGSVLREVIYQGRGRSTGTALTLSADGGIYLAGYESTGGRTNLLVLHFAESSGRLEKVYERANARGLDIIIDRAGALVVAGTSYTKRARDDIFIIRLDNQGHPLWSEGKTFGGTGVDVGSSILETADGNYVLAGYSSSYADGARREQLWVNWMSPSGAPLWDAPLFLGDRFSERAYGVTQIEANSIITAGLSRSSLASRKAQKSDFWLVSIMLK